MGRLDEKVALISGAAGSIGAATARLFAEEGARVVAIDLEPVPLHALVEELGEERAVAVVGEATDAEVTKAAVALALERFGGLDVAFANAGIFGEVAAVADYPQDVFERVLAVNVTGTFLFVKHALGAIRDGGSVILNSSVVGLTSDAGICAYATSKHAIVGLMRTAAKEVADRGIRVNSIHPGPVENAFQERIEVVATGAPADRAAELFEQMIPLARHARPEEIARVALFLASEDSTFVTGATLAVDGGMST